MSDKTILSLEPLSNAPTPTPSEVARQRNGVEGREARGLKRADALAASGQIDKALAALRRVLKDIPGSTRASLKMASLLKESRRANEALQVLERAVHRTPRAIAPREALAETCLELGKFEEAIRHGLSLLKVAPRSLFARELLTTAYLQRGLIDRALSVTEEMIRLDPTDPSHYFKRGVLLQQSGNVVGSVDCFGKVVNLAPESEIAEEARTALEMLDNYQMRQILTLAVEDIPFRFRLLRDPAEALSKKGYRLSEMGLIALSRIGLEELPVAPLNWRHHYYH